MCFGNGDLIALVYVKVPTGSLADIEKRCFMCNYLVCSFKAGLPSNRKYGYGLVYTFRLIITVSFCNYALYFLTVNSVTESCIRESYNRSIYLLYGTKT